MELRKLLFLLVQLIILVIQTSAQFEFLYNRFGTNFSTPNTYQTNLRNVLNSISLNTQITYGYYNFTAGQKPNKVDATVLCRADISVEACRLCASFSAATIQTVCPNTKQAFGYSENCTIYYTDAPAFHVLADAPSWALRAEENATDIPNFNSWLTNLMTTLQSNASLGNSELKFATGKLKFSSNSNQTLYGLVQCSPDLSRPDCVKCVQNITLEVFPNYFVNVTDDGSLFMAKGGRIVSPSCFLRFADNRSAYLKWEARYNIIVGIARGLLYLHEDSRPKIIHRDLKPGNILLDGEMRPKIADFGMANLFGGDQTQGNTSRVAGTFGYMAPEYATTGHFSMKLDIFSSSVIILEIVSGQRNNLFEPDLEVENLLNYLGDFGMKELL